MALFGVRRGDEAEDVRVRELQLKAARGILVLRWGRVGIGSAGIWSVVTHARVVVWASAYPVLIVRNRAVT